jgi:hypothetical protein
MGQTRVAMATAGGLAALGGLATVWLLAAPTHRQTEPRAGATSVAQSEAPASGTPGKVRLRWDPSPDTDLAGYVVSWGDAPSKYTDTRTVGPDVTSIELDMVPRPQPYFIAIQARNRAGQVGGYSNEFGLDLSSGTPRALKVPKAAKATGAKKTKPASAKTPGTKAKLTPEEKAQRRLEKQERKRKAREASKQKQPVP